MSESIIKNLPKIRGEYRPNAALKNWFDLPGRAEVLFKPLDIADLQYFLQNCPKDIPITLLGAASNVIIRDGGIAGVVIRMGKEFAKIEVKENVIEAGAAALCGNVALMSKNAALSGMEFLTGIPGSIGGALAMNAGCYGSDISQILIHALALDYQGNIHELRPQDFQFYYRGNKISNKYIFVKGYFKGQITSMEQVAAKIAEYNKNRENSQPIRAKTGGSTFKNPYPHDLTQKRAWQLIDEVGLRGAKINDAQISPKHCNFLINTGRASANDLIELALKAKSAVKAKLGVDLELEIKILGQD